MSATKANILKLLTLCALAHSIIAPSSALPSSSYDTPAPAATVLAPTHNEAHKYLIVRGENSENNEDFNAAAASILIQHQQTTGDDDGNRESNTEDNDYNLPHNNAEQCDKPTHKVAFSGYDYTVLLSMLIISLGIGVFYGFFKSSGSSSNEFLLGSEMSIFPVTLSLTTSFITAIELLGNPSEMYFQGTQFVLIGKWLSDSVWSRVVRNVRENFKFIRFGFYEWIFFIMEIS